MGGVGGGDSGNPPIDTENTKFLQNIGGAREPCFAQSHGR